MMMMMMMTTTMITCSIIFVVGAFAAAATNNDNNNTNKSSLDNQQQQQKYEQQSEEATAAMTPMPLTTAISTISTIGVPPLTIASSSGSIRRMKAILDAGADPNELDWLGQTALHMAAKFQQTRAAQLLLQRGANCCIANPDFEETPLHLAAKTGSLAIIKLLIDYGADVNARISKDIVPGGTPLLYGALYDSTSFATAKLLLEHGADVTALNSYGQTALHLYTEQMNLRAVTVLIGRYNTDPNLRNEAGCTPLNALAMVDPGNSNQLPIATFLIDRNADINSRCLNPQSSQRTPLHSAVFKGNVPLVKLLLDHGATIDVVDRKGFTPLYTAIVVTEPINRDIVRLLLQRGANPNFKPLKLNNNKINNKNNDDIGTTADYNWLSSPAPAPCSNILSTFLRRQLPVDATTSAVVMLLVSYGAEKDSTCEIDEAPIISKYLNGNYYADPMPVLFMEEGAPSTPSLPYSGGGGGGGGSYGGVVTEIIKAASFGNAVAIIQLLNGTNNVTSVLNFRDSFGKTALHWAVSGEYVIATKALLNAGADVNINDNDGLTPISYAASSGNVGIIKLLLRAGPNKQADLALKYAVERSNSPDAVELLLRAGASLGQTNQGMTLLHEATIKQNIRMMQLLIQYGADVNAKLRENGQTPLSYLLDSDCCYPQIPVLSVLIESGGDVSSRDDSGKTPLTIALAFRRRREVIKYLLDNGADPNSVDSRGCNAPLMILVKLASVDLGRYHLHSITGYDDDDEVALIAKDLISAGALADRRDPCTNKTEFQVVQAKILPQVKQVLLDNTLY